MEEGARGPLFEGVTFTIIPDDHLDEQQVEDLIHALESNGGKYNPLQPSDEQIASLENVTHIVSTHIDFPQYHEACERGVHIVKPSWVLQSHTKGKISNPRQHSPDPSQFFQDVVVTCGELPEGDKDAIIAGVMAFGGQYSSPLTKLTTHIVTTDPNHERCELAKEKKVTPKIVLPDWFDHCLRLGKKINEKPYTFPDPEYLKKNLGKPIAKDSPHLGGATSNTPPDSSLAQLSSSPPSSPSETRKNLTAFYGKKVKISKDLQLRDHLLGTLEHLINYGGGTLTEDVEECDIYVSQYRDGSDYVAASRAKKEVANLSWLYHVINTNKYSNPLSKLLHYPVPRRGIPGFENMKISISNYNGDSRNFVESLIKHLGAEFTKTMKQDNTHLVTAHMQSEKCEAAQEWGLNIVNHLWLEESYAKCAVQPLTNPRYASFPHRTNLGEIVGQTHLDMKRVEQVYFAKPRQSPQKQIQSPDVALRTKPSPRKTVPASSALGASTTPHRVASTNAPDPVAEDAETEDEEQPAPQTAKRSRGRPRKSLATPRLLDDEKENESPLNPSTGRASKQRATGLLREQAGDIALFQKELKRKGGVVYGGRRSSHQEDFSSPAPAPERRKKRTSDEATYDATAEGSDLSDGETQGQPGKGTKKAKTAPSPSLPPIRYRVMLTGDERWVGKANEESTARRKLRMLGVELTHDPTEVDILVAPQIKRTRKFVAALASAPLVVDTKYLDTALKQEKLIEDPKLLEDRESENRLGFKLADALRRAKVNDRKLLRGWTILVTSDVPGGFETYKEIIEVNGGSVLKYAGRTGLVLPKRRLRHDPEAGSESQHQGGDEEYDYVYLISGTTEPEVKQWKSFRHTAEKQDLKPRIVRSDWLLNAAMSQQISWDDKWELDENAVMNQRDR